MHNIFSDPAAFMGDLEPDFIRTALSEFYGKIREIKERLDWRSSLIDGYIEVVFSAIEVTNLEDAVKEGYSDGMGRLRSLCRDILQKKGDKTHPMYWQAKAFMNKHPLPDNPGISRSDIYAGALMPDFGVYAVEEYYKNYCDKLKNDQIERIDAAYKAICDALGTEEPMQELNQIIKKYFLRVPVMLAFLQGVVEDMLGTLACYVPDLQQYTLSAVMDIRGKN